ncbi:hypothetical protein CAEBREN_12590 [Caenorhabditis brenneri]|uniref:F-box domain-containing protein n=1 Tax=Caenorhabditis brenneri TaxID=135651 RepID=G0MYN7_CAEBE|nr:hypothetical protein CAEBREN_12590 [Caenorhabditis brenneri]
MFDYEKYILKLHEPILLKILRFLRLPDLINLRSTCPELRDYCDLNIRLLDQEFRSRPFFQCERCAPDKDVEEEDSIEIMSGRQNASMTYYSKNQSAYLFGGETLGSNEDGPAAAFNDLWRLDTCTMKWNRIIISSAPYPSPKCDASLIAWKNKLILYGGRASTHNGQDTFYSEVHFFDIQSCAWEYISTDGALKVGGHSALATKNFMITYGQFETSRGSSVRFSVLDLRTRVFSMATFDGKSLSEITDFPRFDRRKSKLVLIREGLALLTGEVRNGDYGSSVLVEFNPLNPISEPHDWRWKRIETVGRWWRPKNPPPQPAAELIFEEEEQDPPPPPVRRNSALPNFEFYQIADIRNSTRVRLVSLGKLKNEFDSNRIQITENYEAVQMLYRDFCRQLHCHLETEFQRRNNFNSSEENQNPHENICAVFKYLNIICRIDNCFMQPNSASQNSNLRTHKPSNRFKIHIQLGNVHSNPNAPNFDDFDKWELRASIRATVNQLHSKYYNIGRMDQLAPRIPMRNSALKRLSIYVSEIDCDVNFEKFEKLQWFSQPLLYPSPVETHGYCLIGAHHEVIMHAGVVKFNERMKRMGQTTLLSPVSNVPTF